MKHYFTGGRKTFLQTKTLKLFSSLNLQGSYTYYYIVKGNIKDKDADIKDKACVKMDTNAVTSDKLFL